MLTSCIACSNHFNGGSLPQHKDNDDDDNDVVAIPTTKKHSIKTLTIHIKGMVLRASGAYKNCKACSGGRNESELRSSEKFNYRYQRANPALTGVWRKKREVLDANVVVHGLGMGLSSGESTPCGVFMEEDEPKEWVAQVEPGVLITFVSMPQGGNDLKRIQFSRELFNKWQAQRWWAENYDKVMELYNVKSCDQNAVPLPTPPRSEDENSKGGSPATPPLSKESLPRNYNRQAGMTYSSSDSLDHQVSLQNHESYERASTPKLSDISTMRTETSSVDGSGRSRLSRADHSGELSVSNASDMVETEWVEQDEPGVYITIRALPNGTRELRRIRFSRERFGEMHARLWWEEHKARIQDQYL